MQAWLGGVRLQCIEPPTLYSGIKRRALGARHQFTCDSFTGLHVFFSYKVRYPFLNYSSMAGVAPTALVLGHSFVKRLQRELYSGFDARASADFKLNGSASVHLFGTGGRTVPKLRANDLHVVRDLSPDIIILEIGTNDLSHTPPEVVGSAIEDLVSLLLNEFSVRAIGVCHVIPRGISYPHAMLFLQQATVLNQYVSVVLEQFPNVFCWSHADFNSPHKDLYLADGVHVNPSGQYLLYRSYRGAVLKALSLLRTF